MNKKTLAVILLIACLAGIIVAWAVSPYIWWSDEISVSEDITGIVTAPTTAVIDETITVTVTINNPTGTPVSGTLLVEIWTSDEATWIAEIGNEDITVPIVGDSYEYTWVAVVGNYKAKATFTTS